MKSKFSNQNKALVNYLIDQIEFLKNELLSKDTIINPIIEYSKYHNEHSENIKIDDINQIKKFLTPKKFQNPKHQTSSIQ